MNRVLTNQQIEQIYRDFIQVNYTNEYRNRYNPLPVSKNCRNWRWEGKDFPRVVALLEFERYISKYNFKIENLLTFNGKDDPEVEYLEGRYKNHKDFAFEIDPVNHNLHSLKIDYVADFVMLNQTLEHIYDPVLCLQNIKQTMKEGGYLYINVPACNAPHSEPYHFYTGYTPMGLASVCASAGFTLHEVGQWGNLEYMIKLWSRTPGWSDYTQLTNPGVNEIQNPVITWCLCSV